MLTPDDVRNVVFSGAWRKERGYDEAEVDRFLARVEATLRGKPLVTARDVLTAEFSPRKRGRRAYKKSQVDQFLDKVALTLMKLEVRDEDDVPRRHRRRHPGGAPEQPTPSTAPHRRRRRREAPAADPGPETSIVPPVTAEPAAPARPERPAPDTATVQSPTPRPVPRSAGSQPPAPPSTATQQVAGYTPPPAPAAAPTAMPAARPSAYTSGPVPAAQPTQPPASAKGAQAAASASEIMRDPARFGALEPAKSPSTAVDKAEVDAFMDRVHATLRGADTISSQDVLNARFNPPAPGQPGYDKEGVVAFLKVVAVSIQNITSRNLRPVDPANVGNNGKQPAAAPNSTPADKGAAQPSPMPQPVPTSQANGVPQANGAPQVNGAPSANETPQTKGHVPQRPGAEDETAVNQFAPITEQPVTSGARTPAQPARMSGNLQNPPPPPPPRWN